MKRILLACLLLAPLSAFADNYATCLLEKLEGVQNDVSAISALNLCASRHPEKMNGVEMGSARGWFAKYDSPEECALESSRSMQSRRGALQVRNACIRLYREPPSKTEQCSSALSKEFNLCSK